MKIRTLAIAVILISSFVLASSSVRADQDDYWYQGRRGHWIQQENAWRFRDVDGNVYRQEGGVWRWYNPPLITADADDWYQGRRGRWIQERNEWLFRDVDGNVYRRYGDSWRWAPPVATADADDDWYQGRRGHWVQERNEWLFRDVDGNVYGRYGDSWRWAPYSHGGAAARWERFLDDGQNRDFARIFRANPNIIHDSNYMDQWTGVRDLFSRDPDVREFAERTARDYDRNTRPDEKWNRLLEANPNFAERYRQNPSIVNDPNLANDEPEIREFMRTNPDVRPYIERQARNSYRDDRDEDLRADSGLEAFMATHPNIARQLRDNPSLINDPQFVRNHPNLHEYLRNHPEARY